MGTKRFHGWSPIAIFWQLASGYHEWLLKFLWLAIRRFFASFESGYREWQLNFSWLVVSVLVLVRLAFYFKSGLCGERYEYRVMKGDSI